MKLRGDDSLLANSVVIDCVNPALNHIDSTANLVDCYWGSGVILGDDA